MAKQKKPTDIGMNRTGVGTAPTRAADAAEGAREGTANRAPDTTAINDFRELLSQEAPPVGSMPPPTSVKGATKTAVEALKGNKATVFLDKLGERLAFERSGVRLYDALLPKVTAAATNKGTLTYEELKRHRDEELEHMLTVKEAIEQLGADPTVMTPCADLTGVQGMGLLQVMTDPRTTLTQCLDALLTAELTDNDGWKMLIAMSEALGKNDLAERFTRCLTEEDEHLANVRRWIAERLEVQLGAKIPSTDFGQPAQP
ncbi:MAG TPA: ferritin-like domain-containing protein [Anaeromyxobacteraceae bacterium]|nr:ferritin-like domain-containing protein [Anaeromyxobacteraceae bacterium]